MSENTTTFKEIWGKLSDIDVKSFTKTKEVDKKEFGYIPWAIAWAEIIKIYPNSTHEILCDDTGFPCFHKEGIGAFCKTTVTIEGHTRAMELPVLNFANKAMKIESYEYTTKFSGKKTVNALNSFEVNTTGKRCLVKNLAIEFGFGIKLFFNADWDNQDHEENKEQWEDTRQKKIGGKGKQKDETWEKVEASYLYWCVDPANSKFTKRLAPKAQQELDYRTDIHDGVTEQKEEIDPNKPDPLKNMRIDVQSIADDILKNKYNKDIRHEYYTDLIKKVENPAELITISGRIKAIDILVKAYIDKWVNDSSYKKQFAKILIADNGTLNLIVSELHTLNPDIKEDDRDILQHYWNSIEELFEPLGYNANPSLALNSMKKHLGKDDMHSVFDPEKLKTYLAYLQTKLDNHKDKVDKPKIEPTVIEPTVTSEEPKKETIKEKNPDKQEALDIG